MPMVLVDTSIWVSFLQEGNTRLQELLDEGKVLSHPFIIGELACGNLENRREILSLLQALPPAIDARNEEALHLIEFHRLLGQGLGYVDVHLLAAALLTSVFLWTSDRSLKDAAGRLRIDFSLE
jgi:predicted nucleic acid-binding protein